MPSPLEQAESVLTRCYELGFALAGICRAEPTEYEAEYRAWIAAGKHGEMDYLARNVDMRLNPRKLVPGARSIICVADRYAGEISKGQKVEMSKRGRVATYARGDDYHAVMRKRLTKLSRELGEQFPDELFRVCVDTAPVLEREHAQRAGLGAVGKHTLLIQRGLGSYVLLGEIITTLELEPSKPEPADPCGTCTRCIDACPTDAISPWSVDATKCISYLTIEHRGVIDEKYQAAMGDWIFGCDICQDVCPHNQPKERQRTAATHSAYDPRNSSFDLLEVIGWNDDSRRQSFVKSAMKRAKLSMMKRNAIIAAANVLNLKANPGLKQKLEEIAHDESEDETVRQAAKDALARHQT